MLLPHIFKDSGPKQFPGRRVQFPGGRVQFAGRRVQFPGRRRVQIPLNFPISSGTPLYEEGMTFSNQNVRGLVKRTDVILPQSYHENAHRVPLQTKKKRKDEQKPTC